MLPLNSQGSTYRYPLCAGIKGCIWKSIHQGKTCIHDRCFSQRLEERLSKSLLVEESAGRLGYSMPVCLGPLLLLINNYSWCPLWLEHELSQKYMCGILLPNAAVPRSEDFKTCVDQVSSLINRSALFVGEGLLESLLLFSSEERER